MKISELKVGEMYIISPVVMFASGWQVGPKNHPLIKCWTTNFQLSPAPKGDRSFIYLGVKKTDWSYMGITKNVHWALYQGEICVLDNWIGQWLMPLEAKESNSGEKT